MTHPFRRQLLRFTLIGSVGFAIDGGVLTLLSVWLGINVYVSRLFSFLLATLATWWLNRRHTFGVDASFDRQTRGAEYMRYLFIQVGGGLINLAVFAWLIYAEPRLLAFPILPLAFGSGVALLWNFFGARWFVYQHREY